MVASKQLDYLKWRVCGGGEFFFFLSCFSFLFREKLLSHLLFPKNWWKHNLALTGDIGLHELEYDAVLTAGKKRKLQRCKKPQMAISYCPRHCTQIVPQSSPPCVTWSDMRTLVRTSVMTSGRTSQCDAANLKRLALGLGPADLLKRATSAQLAVLHATRHCVSVLVFCTSRKAKEFATANKQADTWILPYSTLRAMCMRIKCFPR